MFKGFDRTESGLKIIGLVGLGISGLSTLAVNTWKILKEKDKLDADKEAKAAIEAKADETPAEK